jgi:hypothetical protein
MYICGIDKRTMTVKWVEDSFTSELPCDTKDEYIKELNLEQYRLFINGNGLSYNDETGRMIGYNIGEEFYDVQNKRIMKR